MPKVLYIINRLNLGGPTYNAACLTAKLNHGFETRLVSGMKDETEESSEFIVRDLGAEVVYIKHMKRELGLAEDLKAYREICEIIRSFKPDIVHTHAAKAGSLGRLAAMRLHVPVLVHTFHGHVFHSYFGKAKTRFFLEIERALARKTDAIIALSESQALELSETYKICPASKIKVIPLGFDLSVFTLNMEQKRTDFRHKYRLHADQVAVGIVGRLVPVKNHHMFLQAWQIVRERCPNAKAFIIGDGELRAETEAVCKDLGLSYATESSLDADIVFTSWIYDISFAMSGIDILALSSLNEGTPNSIIEAQAAAKPVVSTNVGGVADIVKVGGTALLTDRNDVDSFAANLIRLIEDKGLRKKMGEAGQAWVQSAFGDQKMLSATANLYAELLQKA